MRLYLRRWLATQQSAAPRILSLQVKSESRVSWHKHLPAELNSTLRIRSFKANKLAQDAETGTSRVYLTKSQISEFQVNERPCLKRTKRTHLNLGSLACTHQAAPRHNLLDCFGCVCWGMNARESGNVFWKMTLYLQPHLLLPSLIPCFLQWMIKRLWLSQSVTCTNKSVFIVHSCWIQVERSR